MDNSVWTVHKRLILVPKVEADHPECLYVLVFDVTPDQLAGSRTTQIPRTPVSLSGVPAIHDSLLDGIVFPQARVAYFGESLDEHGHGVCAQGGQVVGVEALSIFHAAYIGACYQGIGFMTFMAKMAAKPARRAPNAKRSRLARITVRTNQSRTTEIQTMNMVV